MAIAEVPSVTYSSPLDIIELRHKRREAAFSQLAAAAQRHGVVRDLETLVAALARRERLGTTALGKGVALLHARSVGVVRPYWIVGRSTKGLEWPAPDGEPVQLVVLYLSHHEQSASSHLQRLSVAAQALRQQRTRQRLMVADPATAFALLQSNSVSSTSVPANGPGSGS
jgi:mannitol/fructose-specific phosphotransferase system IIA component (Ntr-type)